MIAVTCRNGEHFTIDPAAIERAEAVPDTVLHMVGGRTYVLSMSLDELLRAIRDSHAELIVAQRRMGVATAELADSGVGRPRGGGPPGGAARAPPGRRHPRLPRRPTSVRRAAHPRRLNPVSAFPRKSSLLFRGKAESDDDGEREHAEQADDRDDRLHHRPALDRLTDASSRSTP